MGEEGVVWPSRPLELAPSRDAATVKGEPLSGTGNEHSSSCLIHFIQAGFCSSHYTDVCVSYSFMNVNLSRNWRMFRFFHKSKLHLYENGDLVGKRDNGGELDTHLDLPFLAIETAVSGLLMSSPGRHISVHQ